MTDDDFANGEFEEKSRSAIKREMLELFDVGKELTSLKADQLAQLPLDDDLKEALAEFKRIKVFNAQKRQLRRISKLLRNSDHEKITDALQSFHEEKHQLTRMTHVIENWRDRLISEDKQSLEDFIQQHPNIDRQQLGQLVRNAKKEQSHNKPPSSARKLYRFIRDNLGNA